MQIAHAGADSRVIFLNGQRQHSRPLDYRVSHTRIPATRVHAIIVLTTLN